jgi:glycerol-3-phosphate dehydrogenase
VEEVLRSRLETSARGRVRLVEGAHIVVRKLFDHDRAYLFQNPDGRVVFAIPYEGEFTLIGTTDRDYTGDPAATRAEPQEIAYLCETASFAFARPVSPADVVWAYSGVRSLFDDGVGEAKSASRDYVLELDAGEGLAPLLSIVGGKITTYRKLAEAALAELAQALPERMGLAAGWTGTTPLPGGEFGVDEIEQFTVRLARTYPFLGKAHAARLARAYGTRARVLLGKARSAADLGRQFGATLTEAEVRYLMEQEWARSADDVLWRRSKLGLHTSAAEIAGLEAWMRERAGPAAALPALPQ